MALICFHFTLKFGNSNLGPEAFKRLAAAARPQPFTEAADEFAALRVPLQVI